MSNIYSIAGGKGGTGKSFTTASLGILLAKLGEKVLLIDLDLGASNLHTFLAIRSPKIGLDKYLHKEVDSLEDVTIPTPIQNLSIISSTRCSLEIANINHAQKMKTIRAIRKLDYDYILLDLGSGTHFNTIDFFLTSNKGFLVTTPEPISIENVFRFLQSLYLRKIRQIIKKYGYATILHENINVFKNLRVTSPYHLTEIFEKYDERMSRELEDHLADLRFGLIVNQLRNQVDSTFGSQLAKVCNRHFYYNYYFAGNIRFDSEINDILFTNQIFIEKYHHKKSAQDLRDIVTQLFDNLREPSEYVLRAS